MLRNDYRWINEQKGIFTKEDALNTIIEDRTIGQDTEFNVTNKHVIIRLYHNSDSFCVLRYKGKNTSELTLVKNYYKIESLKKLANLVSDYEDSYLDLFTPDVKYYMKTIIDNLTAKEKDNILLNIFTKEYTKNEE